jgi:adenylate cyclase
VTWWQYFIRHFHSHLAQWEQAIEWCNKSVASGNESHWPYTDLAAAHGWLGHTIAKVLKYDPNFTIQVWMCEGASAVDGAAARQLQCGLGRVLPRVGSSLGV